MEWKDLQTELRRLLALVDGWAAADRIPSLERDLALEKLRALYERLRFADAADMPESGNRPEAAPSGPVPVRIDLEELLAEPDRAAEPTHGQQEDQKLRPVADALADARPAAVPRGIEPLADMSTAMMQPVRADGIALASVPDANPSAFVRLESGTEAGAQSDAATTPLQNGKAITSAESEGQPPLPERSESAAPAMRSRESDVEPGQSAEARQEPVLNSLFDLDDLVDRRRKNRRVILSLYGSEEEDVRPTAAEPNKPRHDRSHPGQRSRYVATPAATDAVPEAVAPDAGGNTVREADVPKTQNGVDFVAVQPPGVPERGATDRVAGTELSPAAVSLLSEDCHKPQVRKPSSSQEVQPTTQESDSPVGIRSCENETIRDAATESPDAESSTTEHPVPVDQVSAGEVTATLPDNGRSACGTTDGLSGNGVSCAPETRIPATEAPVSEQGASEAPNARIPVVPRTRKPGDDEPGERTHQVLGEVIGRGVQTLADRIAAPHERTAMLAQGEPVEELRRAIGVNDRFLMIRDLFGGDASAYERTIDRLEEFDDLDDCLIYIAEQYAWDPNSDGARLLTDLLERKLG